MGTKRIHEQQLLEGLNAHTAHADALAEPLPRELDPLERLKGSVTKSESPMDGCWDYAGEEGVESDELLKAYAKPVAEHNESDSENSEG
jgi:antitoxin VapB